VWNSQLGWPNQNKIGDYYHMVSDLNGADLAWAATFNGEEDVYYVRIPRQPLAAVTTPPADLRLHGPQPNPFVSFTTIRYDVPSPGPVRIAVYDIAGRHIATLHDGPTPPGNHVARWDGIEAATGRAAPPGMYLCRLEFAGQARTQRLLRLK
jgi:hypothetical protein